MYSIHSIKQNTPSFIRSVKALQNLAINRLTWLLRINGCSTERFTAAKRRRKPSGLGGCKAAALWGWMVMLLFSLSASQTIRSVSTIRPEPQAAKPPAGEVCGVPPLRAECCWLLSHSRMVWRHGAQVYFSAASPALCCQCARTSPLPIAGAWWRAERRAVDSGLVPGHGLARKLGWSVALRAM